MLIHGPASIVESDDGSDCRRRSGSSRPTDAANLMLRLWRTAFVRGLR
jgi:hypothetical protein